MPPLRRRVLCRETCTSSSTTTSPWTPYLCSHLLWPKRLPGDLQYRKRPKASPQRVLQETASRCKVQVPMRDFNNALVLLFSTPRRCLFEASHYVSQMLLRPNIRRLREAQGTSRFFSPKTTRTTSENHDNMIFRVDESKDRYSRYKQYWPIIRWRQPAGYRT